MTADTRTVELGPSNVVEALARVAEELPGIGKNSKAAADQGGYAYRGIEAITQHAQPLLAKHGVVFVPKVESWERHEIRVGRDQKVWHDEVMQITYTVYGPGGTSDCITVGPIPAIGRDGTDKGANKCMTQAFKYALLQVLCIADKADDGDQYHQEAEGPNLLTSTQIGDLKSRLAAVVRANGGAYPDEWKQNNMPSAKSPAWSVMSAEDGELASKILEAYEIATAADEPAHSEEGDPAVASDPGSGEPSHLGTDGSSSPLPSAASPEPEYTDDLTRPF